MKSIKLKDIRLRAATKTDCRTIAALYSISSDGVADYIWTTLAQPGEDIFEVGRRRYEREDTDFSYRNCVVVEREGEVIGMLVAFPMQVTETTQGDECDPVLAPYGRLECDNSYYICGMAVFPEYRGQGIGTRLLQLAEKNAHTMGYGTMSLIVFEQNNGAKRLYERFGYREIAREVVVPHPLIHYSGDAVLMVKHLEQ